MTGKNIFTILVTARDGFTTSQYVIEVIRDDKVQISGNVLTENEFNEHTATVVIYDKITKEEVTKSSTNEDGTFEIEISLGTYDIVIEKNGYLRYTLTDAQFKDGIEENIDLGEFKIYAGDLDGSGRIELNDLVTINDQIILELDNQVEANQMYDLNGDGKIDVLDRDMLKTNYSKQEEIVKWK